VAQILDKSLSDEEVCEHTIGNLAGMGLGASLNPISAYVNDAATAIIFIVGSRLTRKWQFLKRTFLPFLSNELFGNHLNEREQQSLGTLCFALTVLIILMVLEHSATSP
jgi:hypothetical protein